MPGLVKADDGRVFVRDKGGNLYKVDPSHAGDLISQGQYDAATQEQVAKRTQEIKSGGALEAAGQGLATGVVGGALSVPKAISALTASAIGEQDPMAGFSGREWLQGVGVSRERIQATEAEHPYAFGAGEIAGQTLGMSPYAGGVSALAGAGTRLLGRGALARTLATGALEGGALGADLASEQAWVRNEQATAAQSLAGIGLGALFGAGGAGAVHGAAALGRGALARVLGRGAGEEGAALGEAATAGGSELEQAAASSRNQRISKALANEAVEAVAARDVRNVRALSRDVAERERLGQVLNDLGITGARDGGIIGKSPEEMLSKAETVKEKAGKALGDGLDFISEQTGPVPAQEILGPFDAAIKKYAGEARNTTEENIVNGVAKEWDIWKRRADANGGYLSLRNLQEARAGLDNLINFEKRTPTGREELLRNMRNEMENVLIGKMDEFASKANLEQDVVAAYRRAKDEYRVAAWAEDALTRRVEKDVAHNKASINDRLAAAAGFTAGAASHGIGFGLAQGLALGALNKFGRQRGSNTIISLGRRFLGQSVDAGMAPPAAAATARAVQTVVDDTSDAMVNGIGKYLGQKGEETGLVKYRAPRAPIDSPEAYVAHATEVLNVANNPEIAADRLQKMVGPNVATQAPRLYAQMAQMASRAANYLAANLPAPPSDPNSVMPHLDNPPPVSKADLMQYNARVEGVEQPLSLMQDIQKNQISPEKVEAIKAVHPDILDMMRTVVFTHLSQRKEPLSYQQRMVLDLALDGNGSLEPSLRSDSLYMMQQAGQQAGADKIPSVKGSIPKISESMGTLTSKLMK